MEINLENKKPDVRRLEDMRSVIKDKEWLKTAENSDLYFMYRGLKLENGLRYDITIIPPKMLGREFIKTKGHVHTKGWQEVYMVLEGQAIYLMQKTEKGNVKDVYAVMAKKGDVVIIPSHWGHMTINPSTTETLKMANWIADECKSDYSLFEKLNGACYYYLANGEWEKNENYKNIPPLRFEEPLKEVPKDLNFLKTK